MYDLHGLHVAEALDVVYDVCCDAGVIVDSATTDHTDGKSLGPKYSQTQSHSYSSGHICFITGSGHHSNHQYNRNNEVSTLQQGVVQFCKSYKIKNFLYIKDPSGYIGGIKIKI